MLMRPNKAETAVHCCHCLGDMAVRMRKVLARPWFGVQVCHLLLLFFFFIIIFQASTVYLHLSVVRSRGRDTYSFERKRK